MAVLATEEKVTISSDIDRQDVVLVDGLWHINAELCIHLGPSAISKS